MRIFRGALDVRAEDINNEMILAAAHAIAKIAEEKGLNEENIVPSATDPMIGPRVAAVTIAAVKSGVARGKLSEEEVMRNTQQMIVKHENFIRTIQDIP